MYKGEKTVSMPMENYEKAKNEIASSSENLNESNAGKPCLRRH